MILFFIFIAIVFAITYPSAKKSVEAQKELKKMHRDYLIENEILAYNARTAPKKENVKEKPIKPITQREKDFNEAISKLYSYGTGYDYYGWPFYSSDDYEDKIINSSKESALKYIKISSLVYFRYKGITDLTSEEHRMIDREVEQIYNLIKYNDCNGPTHGFPKI